MNETLRLFERWKRAKGHESDAAAARALGLHRQAVSNWRRRGSEADAATIVRLCADLGEDLAACLTRIANGQVKRVSGGGVSAVRPGGQSRIHRDRGLHLRA